MPSTPNCSEIIANHSFFIRTFSNKKYFGCMALTNLTNSKNKALLGSWKPSPLPATEKPTQGEPPIIKSTSAKSFGSNAHTSPTCIVLG